MPEPQFPALYGFRVSFQVLYSSGLPLRQAGDSSLPVSPPRAKHGLHFTPPS